MMRRPRRVAVWACTTIAALSSAPAFAGPPYLTDDPEPTDLSKWEIYSYGLGTLFYRGGDWESGLDINYGGAKNLQLSVVIADDYSNQNNQPAHVGMPNTELGLKYRFLQQSDGSWIPDVSLFPKIELPSANKYFGSTKPGFSLPLWAQKDFGPWSLFGGGGWTFNPGPGNHNYSFGGVGLTRQVTDNLSLGVEAYYQTASEVGVLAEGAIDTHAGLAFRLGASWKFAPKWSLIGSAGPLIGQHSSIGDSGFYVAVEFNN
ncbi:hypothetical protein DWU98_03895 [Dyella monticola]|uniref:Transporter n=1 Tax=Dyella monticola TaxID=1927958 RepID=A0A370X553_9GAMM|nr:transporter [Dyella monticola]RDS83496.1 hypothetical protein DWU98_03895 [Dyella monticola]